MVQTIIAHTYHIECPKHREREREERERGGRERERNNCGHNYSHNNPNTNGGPRQDIILYADYRAIN